MKEYIMISEYDKKFTIDEMDRALEQISEKKKGGYDKIEPAMLKNMSEEIKREILETYNNSWERGMVPGQWKKAIILPLLKANKDPSLRESYRPVSLTPVLVKVMERMVTNRLYCWLEENNTLNKWQAGFQRMRNTEEQVLRLSQDIQDGLERKPHLRTIALAVDCTKAYDRVWIIRLLERMMDEKIPKVMISWFKSFLEDRKAKVKVNEEFSKWTKMKDGLPQGAVCSPVLFLIYANEWDNYKEENVEYSGFADDLCIWTSSEDVEKARERLEKAASKIESWAKKNKIELNPTKSEACIFTNSLKDRNKRMGITMGGKVIEIKKEITFLGITLESNMSFTKQKKRVVKRIKERMKIIGAIAKNEWGWDREKLITIYKTMVESNVWYAASAWLPWISKSKMEDLERAQREAIRKITGQVKSTPKEYIYEESNIEPLRVTAKRKAITMYEKVMRMPEDNPLKITGDQKSRT